MEEGGKIESAQAEIDILKKRIAELESVSSAKEQEDIVKEVIHEHAEKIREQVLSEEHRMRENEINAVVERVDGFKSEHGARPEEAHQRQIVELLQIAQDKGILNAISIVKRIGDPHIEDDFHAALVKYVQGVRNA